MAMTFAVPGMVLKTENHRYKTSECKQMKAIVEEPQK
jgi:hypothetical protein